MARTYGKRLLSSDTDSIISVSSQYQLLRVKQASEPWPEMILMILMIPMILISTAESYCASPPAARFSAMAQVTVVVVHGSKFSLFVCLYTYYVQLYTVPS